MDQIGTKDKYAKNYIIASRCVGNRIRKMGVLKGLTDEYFGEIKREEDRLVLTKTGILFVFDSMGDKVNGSGWPCQSLDWWRRGEYLND